MSVSSWARLASSWPLSVSMPCMASSSAWSRMICCASSSSLHSLVMISRLLNAGHFLRLFRPFDHGRESFLLRHVQQPAPVDGPGVAENGGQLFQGGQPGAEAGSRGFFQFQAVNAAMLVHVQQQLVTLGAGQLGGPLRFARFQGFLQAGFQVFHRVGAVHFGSVQHAGPCQGVHISVFHVAVPP